MAKHPNPKRIQALKLFCEGQTLDNIAGALGVNENTVRTWHNRYDWPNERQVYEKEVKKTIFGKLTKKAEESAERYLEVSRILGQICVEVLQKRYRQGLEKFEKQAKEIKEWAIIANYGVKIANEAMPTLSEEVAERILIELEKVSGSDKDKESYARFKEKIERSTTKRLQPPTDK